MRDQDIGVALMAGKRAPEANADRAAALDRHILKPLNEPARIDGK
jgi:hypothetical protein